MHRSLVYNVCKSGVGMRSRPRIAQRFRKSQGTADGACSDLTALGFFIAPDGALQPPHKLNWRKLLENAIKLVRPLESRGRRPLAQSSRAWSARKGCLWQAFSGKRAGRPRIAEASIVSFCQFLFAPHSAYAVNFRPSKAAPYRKPQSRASRRASARR